MKQTDFTALWNQKIMEIFIYIRDVMGGNISKI
jgi:hypothetical protein